MSDRRVEWGVRVEREDGTSWVSTTYNGEPHTAQTAALECGEIQRRRMYKSFCVVRREVVTTTTRWRKVT